MSRRLSPWSRAFRPRLDRLECREVPAIFLGLDSDGVTLRQYDSANLAAAGPAVPVTGLDLGTTLVGIDFRGSNGQLYGVSSNSRLFTIDPVSGAATAVGGVFGTPLNGNVFGVDFNPAADKLRIVSDADQNLRVNADTGAVIAADAALAYDPATYTAKFNPQPPVIPNPNVVAGAYTKTANGTGGIDTTLFVVDNTNNSALSTQGGPNGTPSPNGGVLFPIGSLAGAGLNPSAPFVGFDIEAGTSLALLSSNGRLFSVDLATAAATDLGGLPGTGGPAPALRDLAILPAAPTLSAVADQTIAYNGSTGPLAVTIADGAAPVTFTAVTEDPGVATATVGGAGANRTVTVTANPTLTAGGTTTVILTATDRFGRTGTRTFTVTVAAATPPTANPDGYTTPAGQTLTVPAPGVLSNDTVGSGAGPLTVVNFGPLTPAAAGTFTPATGGGGPGGGGFTGGFTFVPAAGFSGTATVTYTVSDGVSTSAPTTVTLTVQPPVTAANDAFTVPFGGGTVAAPGVLANDTVTGGGTLKAALVQDVPAGTGKLTLNPDGSFTYTPAAGFGGPVSFQYAASNGASTSAPATVTLTIAAAAAPVAPDRTYGPVAAGAALTVPAAQGLLSGVASPNGGTLRVINAVPAVGAGTLTVNPDGSFTFTPPAGSAATTATFTYQLTDDLGPPSNVATARVSVTAGALPPVARFTAFGTGAGVRSEVRVVRPGRDELRLFPFEESFQGGVRVAVADLNLDGVDDIAVTAGPGGGPRVVVYNGDTGKLLANFFAYEENFRGGAHVAAADGVRTLDSGQQVRTSLLVLGAGSYAAQPGAPRVRAFRDLQGVPADPASGGDQGTAAIDFFAYNEAFQGGVRVAAGDLDGNGSLELVTIPGPSGAPHLKVYDPSRAGPGKGEPFPVLDTLNGLGADRAGYRGGAFVAVSGGVVLVTPDSVVDFPGTVLDAQSGTLPDTFGRRPPPTVITQASTSSEPFVAAFVPSAAGLGYPASPLRFDLADPGFRGGVRVAAGVAPGGTAARVLAAYGPGGRGRVRQFTLVPPAGPVTTADQVISRTTEANLSPFADLAPNDDFSIYVGQAPLPLPRAVTAPAPFPPAGTGGTGTGGGGFSGGV